MTLQIAQLLRVAKRLSEANGYLELGLTQRALDCLEGLGPLGPFEVEVGLLRGEALRRQRRYREAASVLEAAAQKSHSPQDQSAWLALSQFYRQAGSSAKAIQMFARARGAHLPKRE